MLVILSLALLSVAAAEHCDRSPYWGNPDWYCDTSQSLMGVMRPRTPSPTRQPTPPTKQPTAAPTYKHVDAVPEECLERRVDYPGNDITLLRGVPTSGVCQDLCQKNPGCEGVLSNEAGGSCWLKNAKGAKGSVQEYEGNDLIWVPKYCPGTVSKVIYSSGTTAKAVNTGTISVVPGVTYRVEMEVLRNDLGSSSERVTGVTLDGQSIGGCNPDGVDYDCTFFDCPVPADTTITSQSGSIAVEMNFVGHSWDCDCDVNNWACSQENTVAGRTPMTAAARFKLVPVATPAPTSSPTTFQNLQASELSKSLEVHPWQTAQDGDALYKCNEFDLCFVNVKESRSAWTVVARPALYFEVNSAFSMTDGDFAVTEESITFTGQDGQEMSWPFECNCS